MVGCCAGWCHRCVSASGVDGYSNLYTLLQEATPTGMTASPCPPAASVLPSCPCPCCPCFNVFDRLPMPNNFFVSDIHLEPQNRLLILCGAAGAPDPNIKGRVALFDARPGAGYANV